MASPLGQNRSIRDRWCCRPWRRCGPGFLTARAGPPHGGPSSRRPHAADQPPTSRRLPDCTRYETHSGTAATAPCNSYPHSEDPREDRHHVHVTVSLDRAKFAVQPGEGLAGRSGCALPSGARPRRAREALPRTPSRAGWCVKAPPGRTSRPLKHSLANARPSLATRGQPSLTRG